MTGTVIKVVMIGDGDVGKTCLVERFINNTFAQQQSFFDVYEKDLVYENKNFKLMITDCGGRDFMRIQSY